MITYKKQSSGETGDKGDEPSKVHRQSWCG